MSSTFLPTVLINPNVEVEIILREIYYRPEGYYQSAEQLHRKAKEENYTFNIDDVKKFLRKQAIWQIHSPKPNYIPRASYNRITTPNEVHQADLLYLTHDKIGEFIYKYCLCVCDVASRYKVARPLFDRTSKTIAKELKWIYKNTPLIWPKVFQVDDGAEFKGKVNVLMEKKRVRIRVGKSNISSYIFYRVYVISIILYIPNINFLYKFL